MNPKSAIVIRTYNEEAMLGRTLEAIATQGEHAFEVILVDSGSTDHTLEIARSFPGVRIIEISKKEFTYGRALNIGIAACTPGVEYVVLLSAHAVPCSPQWLENLLEPLKNDSTIVGVYGKQIPHPEHVNTVVMRYLAREVYPRCYGDKPYTTNTNIFFSNVNAAIRRSWWDRCPFDEQLHCEDWAWCQKVMLSGGWIAYQPEACVLHSHRESLWAHYLRYRKQAHATFIINPEKNKDAIGHLLTELSDLTRQYIKLCKTGYWGFRGSHFDRYRVQFVESIARYRAKKELPNG